MQTPKISIIVPIYNVEQYLSKCIDSILAQIFTDFELLLIDDGTPDRSGVICDEYAMKDDRIRVFHKENGGVSSARNLGLDEARGEWVAFVDSDDWIEKEMYQSLYNVADSYDVDVVMCGYSVISTNRSVPVPVLSKFGGLNTIDKNKLIARIVGANVYGESVQMGTVCSVLIKKESINGLRFSDLRYAEDKLFLLELILKVNNVFVLSDCFYNYRVNEHSVTRRFDPTLFNDLVLSIRSLDRLFNQSNNDILFKQERLNNILMFFVTLLCNEAKSNQSFETSIESIKCYCRETNMHKLFSIYNVIGLMKKNPIWILIYFRLYRITLMIYKLKK